MCVSVVDGEMVKWSAYSVQRTVYSVQRTAYSVQRTAYSVQCAILTKNLMRALFHTGDVPEHAQGGSGGRHQGRGQRGEEDVRRHRATDCRPLGGVVHGLDTL
jgi:hypothetical protein